MREQIELISQLIREWDEKQGHEACWYYPEIFTNIASILGIKLKNQHNLPSKEKFQNGCSQYQKEIYKEMQIYSVGPNTDTYSAPTDGYEWCVYWYEIGDYCGYGQAIYYDGKDLWSQGLDHCSCYGPFESSLVKVVLDSDNVLDKDIEHEEIRNKVKELLGI